MRAFHGARVGAVAKPGWYCDGCGRREKKKPLPMDATCCHDIHYEYFKSVAEVRRWGELRLLVATGKIRDLRREVRYNLHAPQPAFTGPPKRVGFYKADFVYVENEARVIEDVKGGADTHMSRWKRRHAEAEYGIKINIIQR